MQNVTEPKDGEIVAFKFNLSRETREKLQKLAKRNHRTASSQLIHMIEEAKHSSDGA